VARRYNLSRHAMDRVRQRCPGFADYDYGRLRSVVNAELAGARVEPSFRPGEELALLRLGGQQVYLVLRGIIAVTALTPEQVALGFQWADRKAAAE
jgi:hypothetical protein